MYPTKEKHIGLDVKLNEINTVSFLNYYINCP